MTEWYEIVIVMDIVSSKKTSTIARKGTNVRSTAFIIYHSKKVRDGFISFIILLVVFTIICYQYAKPKGLTQNGNSRFQIVHFKCGSYVPISLVFKHHEKNLINHGDLAATIHKPHWILNCIKSYIKFLLSFLVATSRGGNLFIYD